MVILNEKRFAEDCLNSGNMGNSAYQTIVIIAKYLYHVHGYSSSQIQDILVEFLKNNYPQFSVGRKYWEETCEKIAGNVKDTTLHEVNGFWITQSELDRIDTVPGLNLQKLAFTILCYAKMYKLIDYTTNYWVNTKLQTLFSDARVAGDDVKRAELIRELVGHGLLEMSRKVDSVSVRVTFVDEESMGVINVTDIRELGYVWLRYKGYDIVECVECGVLMRDNKEHNRRYCSKCRKQDGLGRNIKLVKCECCGQEFYVSVKNNKTVLCAECNDKVQRINSKHRVRKFRSKKQDNEKSL